MSMSEFTVNVARACRRRAGRAALRALETEVGTSPPVDSELSISGLPARIVFAGTGDAKRRCSTE